MANSVFKEVSDPKKRIIRKIEVNALDLDFIQQGLGDLAWGFMKLGLKSDYELIDAINDTKNRIVNQFFEQDWSEAKFKN